jgi:hypothetical protein
MTAKLSTSIDLDTSAISEISSVLRQLLADVALHLKTKNFRPISRIRAWR